jgi:hypothetical protein
MSRSRPFGGRSAFLLLLALLSCAFVLGGSQPEHSHAGSRPGFYNAECPLLQASIVRSEGWAPSPATPLPLSIVVLLVVSSAPEARPDRSLVASSPRAPPLA